MLIGASIATDDIDFYEPLFPGNDIMRVFPVTVAVGGVDLKVLPKWSDARLAYCRRHSTIPFLSCKVDGDAGGLAHVRRQLEDMPDWIDELYITDRHEPEGDLPGGPAEFKRNFADFLAMIDSLPAHLRRKIRCGPVLTQTWTENPHRGNYDYSIHDTGTGDFLGIDCYVPAGTKQHVMTPGKVPAPAEFLKHIEAYAFKPADARPRIFPELGLIGMPDDLDGSARAAWIRGVHERLATWRPGAPGWNRPWTFLGWIWWNQEGKNTGWVDRIGGRRDFPLDERSVDEHTVVKLRPPKPLDAFNAIWAAQHRRPRAEAGLMPV